MNEHTKILLGLVCASVVAICGANAVADIDSTVINTRVWNDDSGSTLTTVNSYPTGVEISDTRTGGGGFANLHNFHLADAGVEHAFDNDEAFSFYADFTMSGDGHGEGGLQLSPWWSPNVDGRVNFRTTDGEIAVFGGRLPFYSFTASQSLTYTKGDTVRVGMEYNPNSLSAADPATIIYNLSMGAADYTSGVLAFDEGNPAEDPPYGLWGHLNDARLGGYVLVFSSDDNLTTRWDNISYSPVPVPGAVVLGFLGLGTAATKLRRRRNRRQ
ncbi:MAG: hypothetical protein GY809_29770 [Planctomycetes bacterium]|nr:hypothetical protein [Planctomycetota bacterium]